MACRKGHQSVVQILLAAKANANVPLTVVNRFTPLHAAANAGCEDVVLQLCEARARLDQPTGDIEATPLYLAAAKGFVDVVKVLCNANADVNKTPTCTSATPLYMACLNGHMAVVRALCLAKADLDKEFLRNKQTPLIVAAKNEKFQIANEIAKTLSAAHADLEKASATKVTPLHMACMNGNFELVEGLVRNKVDVNRASSMGVTPLHLTALNNHPHLARYLGYARADKNLCAKKPGSTPLMMAVMCGHHEVVDVLCEDEPHNLLRMLSTSPLLLHVAARSGHDHIVWRLCASSANVNEVVAQEVLDQLKCPTQPPAEEEFAEDNDEDTLGQQHLTEATEEQEDVATSEKEGEADAILMEDVVCESVEYSLHLGSTPLFLAALAGHLGVVQILIQAAAQVDSTNININDGMTPLMAAVEQSHTAIVQCLLQSHANVNGATSTLGATPLYIAATTGNNPMVYLLCEQKANVCKGLSHTGQSPLFAAAERESIDVIRSLLGFRADVNQAKTDNVQDTPLTMCAEFGFVNTAQELCLQKADVNKATAETGATAILIAADNGHAGMVQCLAMYRADPNKALLTSEGLTALAVAARKGFVDVMEQLVQWKADVNHACSEMRTALMFAAEHGHTPAVKRLASMKAKLNESTDLGRTALHIAIQEKKVDVVNALCCHRADVNYRAKDGATPLLIAAEFGEFNAAKSLIDLRANLNLSGAHGYAPVHFGVFNGDHKLVEYLMRHRADVKVAATDGTTPLHAAVHLDDVIAASMVLLLLPGEADVNKQNKDGFTPVVAAVERHQVDVVKILCEKRADVEICNEKGTTALLMAAETSQSDTAELLLKHHADVNRSNVDFRATPVHIATVMGNAQMVRKLAANRAQVDKTTTRGHTPLHYAAWGGHLEVTQALLEAGADKHLCVQNKQGVNAFFMAVIQDHQEILQTLLKFKGSHRPNLTHGLLHLAARNGQVLTVKSLCQLGCYVNQIVTEENIEGIVNAARLAHCQHPCNAPSSLITLEEDLDNAEDMEEDDEGEGDFEEDVIHVAVDCEACYGGVSSVGYDVLQVGSTPLFMAAYFGHSHLIQILLDARASIDQPDVWGYTPLSAAAEEGKLEVVKILCRKRANVNSANQSGMSALQLASMHAHKETVEELCRWSADVNYVNKRAVLQCTALHMAIVSQCVDIVRFLCQCRACLTAFNVDGLTPIAIAAERGNPRIVQTLVDASADGNIRSPSIHRGGNTAMDLAREGGYKEVEKILARAGVRAARGEP